MPTDACTDLSVCEHCEAYSVPVLPLQPVILEARWTEWQDVHLSFTHAAAKRKLVSQVYANCISGFYRKIDTPGTADPWESPVHSACAPRHSGEHPALCMCAQPRVTCLQCAQRTTHSIKLIPGMLAALEHAEPVAQPTLLLKPCCGCFAQYKLATESPAYGCRQHCTPSCSPMQMGPAPCKWCCFCCQGTLAASITPHLPAIGCAPLLADSWATLTAAMESSAK